MIGKPFLVIIVVVDCPCIGRSLNVKSSFLLLILKQKFSIIFSLLKFQYYILRPLVIIK